MDKLYLEQYTNTNTICLGKIVVFKLIFHSTKMVTNSKLEPHAEYESFSFGVNPKIVPKCICQQC